jgi:hypothetical protein
MHAWPFRMCLCACLVFCLLVASGFANGPDEGAADRAAPELPLELVENGGFEESDREGSPVGWRAEWGGYVGVTIDLVERARSGRKALRLKSPTSPVQLLCFNRPLQLQNVAGREIAVSWFYRTTGQPLADVSLVTYAQPFAERGLATPYLTTQSYPVAASRDWRLVSWRIWVPASACEGVISLRSSGAGEIIFDDVSVRPSGHGVYMEPLQLGEVVSLPARRQVRVRVHNDTAEGLEARLSLTGEAPTKTAKRLAAVKVPPGAEDTVTLTYDLAAAENHRLGLALDDTEQGSVLDALVASVPSLLSGQVTTPAFRGILLSSLATDELVVEGQIHASEEVCAELRLEADLGGAGCVGRDGDGITRPGGPNTWRLVLPRTGMLTGRYGLTVTAWQGKRLAGTLALEVARAPEQDHETAYDAEGRFYVDGRPTFVNGIYNVNSIEDLERVAAHGFNTVVVAAGEAGMNLVERAQELGIMLVIYSPDQPSAGTGPELSFWEHAVGKYGRLPGVIGWHLLEWPDASLMPFDVFEQQQAEIAKIDEHHPTITLLSVLSLLPHYVPACDIVALESQPIPALPVVTVGDDLVQARRCVGPNRPLWAAVQSVGRAWLVTGGGVEKATTGRPPTGPEHRAMTFLALVYGAQGLLHHGFYLPRTADRDAYYLPTDAEGLWGHMKETNRMIASLAEALSTGSYRGVARTEPVHVGAWELDGRLYVVAVNAEPLPALTTFEVPGPQPDALWRLDDGTPVATTPSGRFADQIPGHDARVYVSALPEPDQGAHGGAG